MKSQRGFPVIGLFLIGGLLAAREASARNVEYSTYTDTQCGFKIKYPKGLGETRLGQGAFQFRAGKTAAGKNCLISALWTRNSDRHSWKEEYRQYLNQFAANSGYQITYKAFGPNFFVVSGFERDGVFYHKEIPVQRDGQWTLLTFDMRYFREEKDFWDPHPGGVRRFPEARSSYKGGSPFFGAGPTWWTIQPGIN